MDNRYINFIEPGDLDDLYKIVKNMTVTEYFSDNVVQELLETLDKINDPKKKERKLGGKLTEILDLINEVNFEVLNNSSKYYFHLKINNQKYAYYLFGDNFGNIENVSIEFVEGPYFIRTLSITYTDINKINKEEVMKWMLDVIFKEDLSC